MKPILFNTEMVQAIMEGRKTQTRRPIKTKYPIKDNYKLMSIVSSTDVSERGKHEFSDPEKAIQKLGENCTEAFNLPYKIGDILYVRETWIECWDEEKDDVGALYKADLKEEEGDYYIDEDDERRNWIPSIHMPKKFARIFLNVTNVRVERVQDINEEDVIAEGVTLKTCPKCGYSDLDCRLHMDHKLCSEPNPESLVKSFGKLWASAYEKRGYGWDKNPWVWVYEFEKIEERHNELGF